ncbi:MAG TPA: MoxR family ATPase [Oscillospiraceae bacterium]|nr:MoxR family ATPase [Oscillospiraceae bacterium]
MKYSKNVFKITNNINTVLTGKSDVVELAVTVLLAQGHLLLEDVPGVGKTTLANALSKSIGCGFSRIQFTPDTLPGDVTGSSVYNMKTGAFEFLKGAVMSNIVLADEINRTSPKTQASLLEAMEERQVTVDSVTYQLEQPFMVIATQNPVDFLGTYNLPEAQLDRFMMKLSIGYPSASEERMMADNFLKGITKEKLFPVVSKEEVVQMQEEVKTVNVSAELNKYIVDMISLTRNNELLVLGASPRATLALIRASQAAAYVRNRDYVMPDDVQLTAPYVLSHRLALSTEARLNKATAKEVIEKIINKVKVPVL